VLDKQRRVFVEFAECIHLELCLSAGVLRSARHDPVLPAVQEQIQAAILFAGFASNFPGTGHAVYRLKRDALRTGHRHRISAEGIDAQNRGLPAACRHTCVVESRFARLVRRADRQECQICEKDRQNAQGNAIATIQVSPRAVMNFFGFSRAPKTV
jgi:hypothetical protein